MMKSYTLRIYVLLRIKLTIKIKDNKKYINKIKNFCNIIIGEHKYI